MKTNPFSNQLQSNQYGRYAFLALLAWAFAACWTLPAGAQSSYSNVVMSLHPVAYWPLQETNQPPTYDEDTNLGTLGPVANIYYASTNATHSAPGAIVGDSDTSVNFAGTVNSFAIVPTTDNRVSLTAGQPFTVECWARATGSQSYVAMVNQTGHNSDGSIFGGTNSSGWMLGQNYSPAWTDFNVVNGNHPAAFSFHVFNGLGDSGGAEAQVVNSAGWNSGGSGGYVNAWVYLCGVFDGTNCWLYMFSTNLVTADSGTNAMDLQLPITTGPSSAAGVPGNTYPNAEFSPDTWDPITFGCNRGYGANPYHGSVDEVAIYTNMLTWEQITNHFMAGTNGLGNYQTTILGDSPYMYWRMDAPRWTNPPASTYPPAVNFGTAAASSTNTTTTVIGANCGVYQPGTIPGVPGPSGVGFGSLTNACGFSGIYGAVDIGYNQLFDPTGVTNNFTMVLWFAGNPMEVGLGTRWECMASHTDKSWKAQFKGNDGNPGGETIYANKVATGPVTIAPGVFNANDGRWHMYVLESTYTNGVSTNVSLYLDSGLVSATVANANPVIGTNVDAWIGGAPDYAEPTNEATYNASQQFFAGKIAHVAYFTNALTLSQIQSLYYTAVPAPVILTQPVSAAIDQYSAFTNTVVVSGSSPLYYQWYTNRAAISGATNASIIFNSMLPAYASSDYYVVITNIYGAATSSVVSLTVVSNLTFTAQFPVTYTNPITLYGGFSANGTNYVGSTPTFSVQAIGAVPITYQWYTNGMADGGAIGASFTFTNCPLTGPTNFYCVAANTFGTATSTVWSVSYIPATTAPYPQVVLADQPVGYWRLNEADDQLGDGNPGAICNDYQSGNNAIYTNVFLGNVQGGTGYSQETDPGESSALFGYSVSYGSFAGQVGTNIDFSQPNGASGEFTVAIWANGNSYSQSANAGLVAKGYFFGEELDLDEGAPGNDVRFEVRNAAGTAYNANSTFSLAGDSYWHFIVGVCDEANSNLSLWIDGSLAASVSIPTGSGITNSLGAPLMIGARSSTANPPGNNQFRGFLNEASVFSYALSSNQVQALYAAPAVPAFIVHEPVNSTNVNQGGPLVISATAGGSAPLAYQWYDASYNTPVAGQTNATLVIANVGLSADDGFYLIVTNNYGTVESSYVSVSVYSGAPQLNTDVINPFYGFPGGSATNYFLANGSVPLVYQWQYSNSLGWVNLPNLSRISGAQSNSLVINNLQVSDQGNYQVVVTNSSGVYTSSVATLIMPGVLPLAFNNGLGWTTTGSSRMSSGTLSLTDPNNGGGNGTYFFQVPQYIGGFEASFTYQAGGNRQADGVTFCLQNAGLSATGGGGGQLGYEGIIPSVAVELNIFSGNGVGGVGYSVDADGGIGPTTPPGGVVLNNGDPINVIINYLYGQMSLTFTDTVSTVSFSTNLDVGDITQILGGNTAFVGFTGAYGGDTSVQTISDFTFVSIPPEAIRVNSANAMVTWPGSVLGYTLQQNSDLANGSWLNVTNPVVLSNGTNLVTVPSGGTNQFYRLILPQ